MTTQDPREARFLASQAERLSSNRTQQANCDASALRNRPGGVDTDGSAAPRLVDEDVGSDHVRDKERGRLFWKRFRSLCAEFQRRIDSLLLLPSSSSASSEAEDNIATSSGGNEISNDENARAHYATAARRNEGRIELDFILHDVRSLQRHVLSSSSSVSNPRGQDEHSDGSELLWVVLHSSIPDVTQTDVRLISQEIDSILKRIDGAREVICPKEKFVFKRYRRAMEKRERLGKDGGGGVPCSTESTERERNKDDSKEDKEGETKDRRDKLLRSKYGGVLEDMSNCTVEISSDGTMLVNQTPEDRLHHYSAPRPVDALHPTSHAHENQRESSSYLLQNLDTVTVIVHGSRPSLHLQHIRNCRVYAAEPTLGPVHVTDCRSSEVRCSCYQLRVHDSRDVKFDVWVRSGPIIENCNGMAFEGNYYSDETAVAKDDGSGKNSASGNMPGRNMFWDVKDFNWLRALRKSPNFVVVTELAAVGSGEESGKSESSTRNDDGSTRHVETADVPEEDSEDEL